MNRCVVNQPESSVAITRTPQFESSKFSALVGAHCTGRGVWGGGYGALSRLADRIWETRPIDNRRRRAAAEAAAAQGVLPPSRPKRIVALGDGLFSGDFPKKSFARELAMRGPTLIVDEYFTSQRCPCGHPLERVPAAQAAPLDPTDASRRPRRHTGSGGPAPCCAMRPFSNGGTDRDELACICILQCVAAGLDADPSRPAHLSSPKDQDAWRKGQLAHTAK